MDENTEQQTQTARRKRLRIFGVTLIVIAATALVYWYLTRNYESTDDAFVQNDIVMIAPRISGTVTEVFIEDNQQIKTGDALVNLDPRDYQAALDQAQASFDAAAAQLQAAQADLAVTNASSQAGIGQAQASLRVAEAEAARAKADAARYQSLFAKDEISKQVLDQAVTASHSNDARVDEARSMLANSQTAPQQVSQRRAAVAARQAQLAQAQAQLEQARLNLSYTHIVAPGDGRVTRKSVLKGAQVATGSPLLALVQSDPWVVANFKETQLRRMKPGQPASLKIDTYGGQSFSGCVDSFQMGTGSVFSLLPPENATGNFVKVVQRVPVKLVFLPKPDAAHPLLPGMSVVPTVNVSVDPQDTGQTDDAQAKACRDLLHRG